MRAAGFAKGLVLLGLCALALAARASAEAETFTITRVELRTRYASPPAESFLPLIPLQEGKQTTADQIRGIERMLKKSGLFRSVSARLSEEPGGVSVLFDLGQMERVRRIEIQGNWLVLASSIRRVLSMQEGDPFEAGSLVEDAGRIEALFEKKGWYQTSVSYGYEQEAGDGSVRIRYRIKMGHHVRFSRIELEGVNGQDPEKIRAALRIWPWVTANRLDRRLERVRESYGKLGYPTAQIRIESMELEEEKGKAVLKARVDEGKKLVQEVGGNAVLPSRRILEETTFFQNRSSGFFDAEDSAEAIERLYEERGFPEAEVTFQRDEADAEIRVLFSVEEGKKSFLSGMDFQGNQALSERALFRQVLTRPRHLLRFRLGRFLTDKWEKDRNAIVNLYRSEGFQDVRVEESLQPDNKRKNRSRLLVRIDEGPRYTIASWRVEGASPHLEAELGEEMMLRAGEPFHQGKLAAQARRITRFYADRGYLQVSVDTDYRIEEEDHTVDLSFQVDEGARFIFSGLIVTGNRKTRLSVIRNAFRLMEGKAIENEELSETRRRLFRLGIFEGLSIRVPGSEPGVEGPMDDAQDEMPNPVLIELRERESLGIEVGISLDSDRGVEGLLSLREENLLGRAKRVGLDVVGGQTRSEVRLSFADPTLMAQRVTATAEAKYAREVLEAYTEQTVSIEGGLYGKYPEEYTPGLFVLLDHSVVYDVQSSAPDAPDPSETTNLFVRPQIVRDTRGDKLYPKDGSYGQARVSVSNQAWGSDDNLILYELQGQVYHEFMRDWILASRVSLDHADPYGRSDEVPSNYFLFAGGNNSVRGFPKDGLGPRDQAGNPKGGTTRVLGSLELRFPIYRLVNGVAFVDVGSLTEGFEPVGFDTFRWSAGAGLRLHTPVGPVRVEYGYQLQDNPPLDRGEFHFSLGFPF
jgi:outer membrane protein insertion porin family